MDIHTVRTMHVIYNSSRDPTVELAIQIPATCVCVGATVSNPANDG